MEAQLAAALVAAAGAAGVAVYQTVDNAKLRREEKQESAKAILDHYRKPLLDAADDLCDRLHNICCRGFTSFLVKGHPRNELAIRGTLFRLARFLGWKEALERRVTYLQFETERETSEVAAILSQIGKELASGGGRHGELAMLWREEQRAIGGLMESPSVAGGVIGFETFSNNYSSRFSPWFKRFSEYLMTDRIKESERFKDLYVLLAKLIWALDKDHLYTGSGESVNWYGPNKEEIRMDAWPKPTMQ